MSRGLLLFGCVNDAGDNLDPSFSMLGLKGAPSLLLTLYHHHHLLLHLIRTALVSLACEAISCSSSLIAFDSFVGNANVSFFGSVLPYAALRPSSTRGLSSPDISSVSAGGGLAFELKHPGRDTPA
ncbi:hypothetical protein MLD38_002719 [Melastoma candidum]|uniref:Uncharacterized protein n=1 Tax=Melastoma candidum TaxID=119954 RepID=A0ACB9S0W8_9MYRT|nr:hypothetical protein MLD38_002719 [Melastoma candidum]